MAADGRRGFEGSQPGSEGVYGLLSIGQAEVALPLSMLREALVCPSSFIRLPVAVAGLAGAMDIRGVVVAVLDLRARMGLPIIDEAPGIVVVLADGVRRLGVLADELRSVVRVPEADLIPMAATGGELFLTHTFHHPDDGHVISLLNADKILALDGVPVTADVPGVTSAASTKASTEASTEASAKATTSTNCTLTLLRCGDFVLGLGIADVHTTLPTSAARPSILNSELCRGVIDYAGQEIAVLDPLVLLGLGELPAGHQGPGLVLEVGGQFVLLAMSELISIVEVDQVQPLPGLALRRPELLAGMSQTPNGQHILVVDCDALRRDSELAALASMNISSAARKDSSLSGRPAASIRSQDAAPHLRYSLGRDIATPLEQIDEILTYPELLTPTGVGSPVLGVISHRGTAIPVICLSSCQGLDPQSITPQSCLLLVSQNGAQVAFLIGSLRSIEPLTWQEDRNAADSAASIDTAAPGNALSASPLVRLGSEERLVPQLDLRSLASSFVPEATGQLDERHAA